MQPLNATPEASLRTLRQGLVRDAPTPLYRQIVEQLTLWIEQGDWASGQALPTIKQLASVLEVSEMTVRRAFAALSEEGLIESRRGSGTVVAGGAGRIGPGSKAPARRTDRRMRVGVVFASLNDGYPFIQPMLGPLNEPDDPESVCLQVLHLNPRESDPNVIRHQLPLDDLDGMMLMSPVNIALLWLCQRRALPYVLLFNDVSDGVSTCVTCDYHPGIYDAMAHVVAAGSRRPALVTAGGVRFSSGQISDAFRLATRLHGLTTDDRDIVTADYTQQHGYQATWNLLQRKNRPDAIFYSSDHQAYGGWLATRELSLAVPGDVALIGAGTQAGPTPWPQRLSTIDLSLAEMGQLAIQSIRRQRDEKDFSPRRFAVRSTFVCGETTTP